MTKETAPGQKIAVIGAGVAGLTAAWLLQRRHHVTVFEKADRLGGHTNTVEIPDGPDAGTPVDTGFIVCNDRNYPLLHKLLDQLGVAWRWSDMSFGYCSRETGLQYAGTGINGLFAQRRHLLSPSFWSLLREIMRFCSVARADLAAGNLGTETLADFLARHRISEAAIRDYIIPMGAAIWSATQNNMMGFPAASLLKFWENHGLLSTKDRPTWQTVVGGSHAYVKAMRAQSKATFVLHAHIAHLTRHAEDVLVRFADASFQRFDHVVVATHANEALPLLGDPTADEQRLLSPWRYQLNRTLLHTDISVMPPLRRAWASWNYVRPARADHDRPVPVTYDMNRLQGLRTREQYLVTLNPPDDIDPKRIVRTIDYMHPVYDNAAVATQAELPKLVGANRTSFCGSYFGHGFHEDAVRSGVAVAKQFGEEL